MDAQQFAYWLQGFAELHAEPPTPEQWRSIREHLALCFKKVTPPVAGNPGPCLADLVKEMDRARKQYDQKYPPTWPPRDSTGIPPNWMQDGGKTTLIC